MLFPYMRTITCLALTFMIGCAHQPGQENPDQLAAADQMSIVESPTAEIDEPPTVSFSDTEPPIISPVVAKTDADADALEPGDAATPEAVVVAVETEGTDTGLLTQGIQQQLD